MRKENPKSKIEVRSFSGYTLKNRYRKEDRRDIFINALLNESKPITRGHRWFSVVPKANNLIFQLAEQIGPRLGNFVGGMLNAMSRPFNILVRVLFSNKMVWTGSPNFFWKSTISIVGLVYKQAYLALTKKGKLTPEQAEPIARTAARIFCNFMLTTRLSYQIALYQYGIERPEESESGEEGSLSEAEARAIEGLDEEVARELEGVDTSITMNIQKVTKQIISAFRRLRLNQILDRLEPASYQRIAYAFIVNSQSDVSIRWTLYAKGTHAYTSIIAALTDIIVNQVREVSGLDMSMVGAMGAAARRKLRSRSFSEEMEDEHLDKKHRKHKEYEMEELFSDDEYMYDEDEYMYDENYEDEYMDEDEYTEDGYVAAEWDAQYDVQEEAYEDDDDEYRDEYDEYDESEYEYEDEYGDEYEAVDEDLIMPDLEPDTSDYELPEYSESTQIEPLYDEDEVEGQLVETLRSIEPSLSAFRLADKFIKTRTFSNSISLKRNFYNFLVNEFVKTRAFNKKEEKEMEEVAAEIVDKLDMLAEDVKDLRTMLAKAIEAMDIATSDEGGEDSRESDDSDSSWDDFWRSDDSSEMDSEGEEEGESEGEEGVDESSDEAESDEEGEDEKGYRSYYARLRRYKKRRVRMPKKASKPTKKPKTKGI